MPRYELIIPPALEGRTVRQEARGGLRLSRRQFKRAKLHGALMVLSHIHITKPTRIKRLS